MNVEVRLYGRFRELATRQRVVTLTEGARLADLIEWLAKEYGDDFREEVNHLKRLNILISGQYCHNTETLLKEGDVIVILPLLAGG